MAEPKLKLEAGKFYHVYNRGINSCNIFREEENYRYFMSLYDKNISPIAETFAWVLLPNHFHFLIRINDDLVFQLDENIVNAAATAVTTDRVQNSVGGSGGSGGAEEKVQTNKLNPSIQFSKLFNSYAQAFNKRFHRHGSLFERPFRRKLIEDDDYFKTLLMYIHNNPVNHGFYKNIADYQWSSYLNYINDNTEFYKSGILVQLFENIPNFKLAHLKFESEIDFEIDK